MKRNLFFIMLLATVLCGCGYTTHAVLPEGGDTTVHVENFVNKIDVTGEITDRKAYYAYRPGMEADITREVIDKFIFDGNYEVTDAKDARFALKGDLVDFKSEPLRYDSDDNVTEYRVSIVCDIELYDNKEKKPVWQEGNFAGEATYRTGGQYAKSESAATREATKDLARRIVERTVENW